MHITDKLECQAKALLSTMRSRRDALLKRRAAIEAALTQLNRRIDALEGVFEEGAGFIDWLDESIEADIDRKALESLSEPSEKKPALEVVRHFEEGPQLEEDVLEVFAQESRPLRVLEIADALESKGWRGDRKPVYNVIYKLREAQLVKKEAWGVYSAA